MESKLLGNRDPGWEKPQALLGLPTFGETKAVLLAGSFRVPSTAQNIYFLFSSFFCPTITDNEKKTSQNYLEQQTSFFLCHQSSQSSPLEKGLEKWRSLPPLHICCKHTLKSCCAPLGHIWQYTDKGPH